MNAHRNMLTGKVMYFRRNQLILGWGSRKPFPLGVYWSSDWKPGGGTFRRIV